MCFIKLFRFESHVFSSSFSLLRQSSIHERVKLFFFPEVNNGWKYFSLGFEHRGLKNRQQIK